MEDLIMYKRTFWRKYKDHIMFGIGLGAILLFSYKDIQGNLNTITTTKEAIANNNAELNKLNVSRQFEQEQAEIANQRYTEGCLPVVDRKTRKYISINKGTLITDRLSKKALTEGTVVCDAQGSTGVIQVDGTVDKIAFTGNRDLVAKRIKRFRAGTYSQPVGVEHEEEGK